MITVTMKILEAQKTLPMGAHHLCERIQIPVEVKTDGVDWILQTSIFLSKVVENL